MLNRGGNGARRIAYALAGLVMMLLVPTPALAGADVSDVCTRFPHTQTYGEEAGFFRAPAWYYGRTVTVLYDATGCALVATDQGLQLRVAGRADVYEGSEAAGNAIDERTFTSVLSTEAGSAPDQVDWWTCGSPGVDYSWTIVDVYRFSVSATDGEWRLKQTALTKPAREESLAFDGCTGKPLGEA